MKPHILTEAATKELRRKVALRDDFKCVLCQEGATDIHHIMLRSHAAKNSETVWNMTNMVSLCRQCHLECHQHPREMRRKLEPGKLEQGKLEPQFPEPQFPQQKLLERRSMNYLYYVPKDLAEEAIAAGIVHEDTNIDRKFCNCGCQDWGWGIHTKSCLVYQYYMYGGIYAERILLKILDRN